MSLPHSLVSCLLVLSACLESKPPAPSEQVSAIVDELSGVTLLVVSDLIEVLRDKLGITGMPAMMVMMPGMVPGGLKGNGGAAQKVEEKAEKTVFDVKLEGFDKAAKIKVIKEVRTFTDFGVEGS
ncbi:hypothetical protein CMV_029854 [Castanea mollissima]|uniref:Large ribosomal subunit protein bL12 oligomerization domain-containing protein n=1 Tax=Castanea mollissima TaxID=60419 RepID=A0A8J4Q255_9ROSI|nr:hypothetical protein CMV_029854 [Castanea mollissima]